MAEGSGQSRSNHMALRAALTEADSMVLPLAWLSTRATGHSRTQSMLTRTLRTESPVVRHLRVDR